MQYIMIYSLGNFSYKNSTTISYIGQIVDAKIIGTPEVKEKGEKVR